MFHRSIVCKFQGLFSDCCMLNNHVRKDIYKNKNKVNLPSVEAVPLF